MPTCPTELQSDLGSVGERVGPTPSYPQEQELAEQTETVSTQAEVAKISVQGPPSSATAQLEQMLATFITVMQQSNAQLRESLSSNQKKAEHF
jgi:copper(I)-binding protein